LAALAAASALHTDIEGGEHGDEEDRRKKEEVNIGSDIPVCILSSSSSNLILSAIVPALAGGSAPVGEEEEGRRIVQLTSSRNQM
jgi:hypothetical protein